MKKFLVLAVICVCMCGCRNHMFSKYVSRQKDYASEQAHSKAMSPDIREIVEQNLNRIKEWGTTHSTTGETSEDELRTMLNEMRSVLSAAEFDAVMKGDTEREMGTALAKTVATAVDEALFNAPSLIPKVKEYLEKYRKENPEAAALAKGVGLVGGSLGAGGLVVKGLAKTKLLGKLLKGSGWGTTTAKSAIYGTATEIPDNLTHPYKCPDYPIEAFGRVLRATLGGAMFGAAAHGGGKLLGKGVKLLAYKDPVRSGKQLRDQIGTDLFNKLKKTDIAAAKEILADPIKSSHLNLNTLLHRGTEETKGIIDGLYQTSLKVRAIVKRKLKELSEGQMPHIRESIINSGGLKRRPDVNAYVERKARQIKKIVNPLYEKANEVGDIVVPEKLAGDQRFKSAVEKAYKHMNLLDRNKPSYEKHSVRNLHDAKEFIGDDIGKFARSGDNKEKMFASKTYDMLRDTLSEASPVYKKATELSKKYFDIQKAAKGGLEFKDQNLEEIVNKLKTMGKQEQHAYKTGAIQSLLEKAEARAHDVELAKLGKDFTNPEIQRKFEKIIGEGKLQEIVKDIEISNNAVKNISEIVRGSVRGGINLLTNIAECEAAMKMRLLLNPKRLLEYSKVVPKEAGKISPKVYAIKNEADNRIEDFDIPSRSIKKAQEEIQEETKAREKTYDEKLHDRAIAARKKYEATERSMAWEKTNLANHNKEEKVERKIQEHEQEHEKVRQTCEEIVNEAYAKIRAKFYPSYETSLRRRQMRENLEKSDILPERKEQLRKDIDDGKLDDVAERYEKREKAKKILQKAKDFSPEEKIKYQKSIDRGDYDKYFKDMKM